MGKRPQGRVVGLQTEGSPNRNEWSKDGAQGPRRGPRPLKGVGKGKKVALLVRGERQPYSALKRIRLEKHKEIYQQHGSGLLMTTCLETSRGRWKSENNKGYGYEIKNVKLKS